jgi:alginate O-acetyltransferase complex protein AlgI
MLFNSAEYLFLFLPLCLLLHFFLRGNNKRIISLILLSALFYMSAFPLYIFILLGLIVVDYAGVILMERSEGWLRKIWLWICLGSNIALLASFKYWNFIAENINLTGMQLPLHHWILPVGLSFHTFQSLSYILEVYRKSYPAERNFLRYSLYILFFPQMVAGPIERPQNILPQFLKLPEFNPDDFKEGLFLLAKGLFMKAVLADRLALYVNPVFEKPGEASGIQAILAMLFFAIQIYADFSGYSNMALGSARMLGIRLMVNFKQPYLSSSLSDFWRRWHISLSTWFRDYIYIPMGGSRAGIFRAGFNIMVVFLVSGLWHGAGWNFLLWGFLHGAGLLAESFFRRKTEMRSPVAGWLFTQLWVLLCWVFFRAESAEAGFELLKCLVNNWNSIGIALEFSLEELIFSLASVVLILLSEAGKWQEKAFARIPVLSTALLLFSAWFLGYFKAGSFIYFQF